MIIYTIQRKARGTWLPIGPDFLLHEEARQAMRHMGRGTFRMVHRLVSV